ncbi:Elongation factor-1 alpha, partial [uncultured Gammaproteobacteria bacterium]
FECVVECYFNGVTHSGFERTIIFIPFAFLILDVSAWWLTRIDPAFAWLVIIGGFGYSLASAIMLSTSLYQMWVMPWRQSKNNNTQTWFDE